MNALAEIKVPSYLVRWLYAVVVVSAMLAGFTIESLEQAVRINSMHLDGVYQTASALMRVQQGDMIGRDFYFYLGLGPLYSIYPLFSLLGGDVAASIVASNFAVKMSFWLSILVMTRVVFDRAGWLFALTFSAFLYFFIEFLFIHYSVYISFPNFFTYLDPGNSLKPLRRIAPVVAVALLLLIPRRGYYNQIVYLGMISGVMATWSNDYGPPSSLALLLFSCYYVRVNQGGLGLFSQSILLHIATALLVYFALLLLFTDAHVGSWLHYNFVGVSGDQWWYYKPYIKDRIWSLVQIADLLHRPGRLALTVAICIAPLLLCWFLYRAWVLKSLRALMLLYIGVCMYGAGFLSEYLGHMDDYYWAGMMLWLLFAMLALLQDIKIIGALMALLKSKVLPYTSVVCCCLVLIVSLLKAQSSYGFYQESIAYSQQKNVYAEDLGGYVSEDIATYLGFIRSLAERRGQPPSIVEEYFGLASATGLFESVVPYDSVIHALGEDARARYLFHMHQVDYVVTTNPRFSPWQAWNLGQNWWFYRYLHENYLVLKKFPQVVVWQRRKAPEAMVTDAVYDCNIVPSVRGYELSMTPALDSEELVELNLQYEINNSLLNRNLLLLDSGLSYFHRYVSLSLNTNTATAPVFMTAERLKNGVEIKLMPESAAGDYFDLQGCQFKRLYSFTDDFFLDDRFTPMNLNGDTVAFGLDLFSASFYVFDSYENRQAYKPDKTIMFRDGSRRKITEVASYNMSQNMRIEYEGSILAGSDVGYPHKILVVD